MTKKRGMGLLMVWTDVDEKYEEDFNKWYNMERIPSLLKVPGVLSAGRYMAVKGAPKYLAMYELEDVGILRTEAFLQVRYQSSPFSGSVIGRNFIMNGYRQIFPERLDGRFQTSEPARVLQMGRISIPERYEEEFNEWYNTVYIPGYLQVPGVIAARRYIAEEGLKAPKYLTVYEFEHEKVPESPEWEKARWANPWTVRVRRYMQLDEGSPAVFRRIFPEN